MRAALRRTLANLRAFARGFLGLATPLPHDAHSTRARFRDAERKRTPCC